MFTQQLTYLYFYFFTRSETKGISTRQHLYWDGHPETGPSFWPAVTVIFNRRWSHVSFLAKTRL
jgi:hypothetical protein